MSVPVFVARLVRMPTDGGTVEFVPPMGCKPLCVGWLSTIALGTFSPNPAVITIWEKEDAATVRPPAP